jgi:clan AA aspartic protease (TIGR02281 family)
MQGIIEKENENSVVLNVGFGTVEIPKSDIESIEKSQNNKQIINLWRQKYFENYPAPTPKEEQLLKSFRKLKSCREKAIRKIGMKERVSVEIFTLQKDIANLQNSLTEIGTKLKFTNSKKDIVKYNNLVVEFNSLSNKIKSKIDELTHLRKDYDSINKSVTDYIELLCEFVKNFKEKHQHIIAENLTPQQQQFYKNLKERLNYFQEEFRQEAISFKKLGSGILVKAILNQRIQARMLVDTGAELTVISERIAEKLGIDSSKIRQNIGLVLADGRRLAVKLTTLDTIKVGNSEGKNVRVAIIKNMSDNIDGFLGMSFLKNFAFSIDARTQELILSSFNPK